MMHLKLILRTMLSLPVAEEAQTHYLVTICVIAYAGILFLVLKTFQYNKDKFEE